MREGEKHRRLRLAGVVVFMSVLFGNNFVALDVALRHAGPITLQAVAVTFAAVTAWVLTRSEHLPLVDMRRDTVVAIVSVSMALSVASPLLMVYGVERVNPAVAAMLVTSAPISTLILERIVFRVPLTPQRLLGIAVGFTGVGLVVSPLAGGDSSEIIGIIVLIGASFAWAVGLILTRRLPGIGGGGRFVIWQMVAALPVLYVLAFVNEGLEIEWTWAFLAATGYSGVFSKGVASYLQFRTVRVASPLHSSLAAFLVPVVASISAFVILGETVEMIQVAGTALIAISVGAVIRGASSDRGRTTLPPAGHAPTGRA